MNQPVSRSSDRNGETSAIVADPIVVDAQKKRSRVMYREGFARADEKKPIGQNANRGRVLGAIDRAETRLLDPRLSNEDTDQGSHLR